MITGKLGKKDTDTHRVTGREKTGVLVHIGVPEGELYLKSAISSRPPSPTTPAAIICLPTPDVAAGQTYSVRH